MFFFIIGISISYIHLKNTLPTKSQILPLAILTL